MTDHLLTLPDTIDDDHGSRLPGQGPPPGADAMALVERALTAAAAGRTGALMVQGEAGIGRTAFLVEAAARARGRGFEVARGRCHPQDQGDPLGVARQVFAPLMVSAPGLPDSGYPGGPASASGLFDVLVALYRVLTEATSRSPVLLVVDDLQWCDEASLQAISRLVHHAVRLRLVVLVAVRSGEPVCHPTAFQDATGHLRRTELTGLGPQETARLVRAVLDSEPHPDFVLACRQVTGGNPTLLRALLDELARRNVLAGSTRELLPYAPEPIARDAEARIHRLGGSATALARAVAVLGDGAELGHAAALAALPRAEAAEAADRLIRAGVLSNHHQLAFQHPIVGAAIAGFLPAGTASTLRVRAALILHQAGGHREAAVEQLLRTDPVGESWALEVLRAAGLDAAAAGRPASAVQYLARALQEPQPDADTTLSLLRELGAAESRTDVHAAIGHLSQAAERARGPFEQAQVAEQLADALAASGSHWRRPVRRPKRAGWRTRRHGSWARAIWRCDWRPGRWSPRWPTGRLRANCAAGCPGWTAVAAGSARCGARWPPCAGCRSAGRADRPRPPWRRPVSPSRTARRRPSSTSWCSGPTCAR